nr:uncharacterized protein LOC108182761 [Danio rerio]|eukprot:XP_021328056.1 uncharacterized protein LOC108182761 [Danio rerio]
MLCVLGLIGAGDTHVFSSSGETVHLPCRNTVQQCRPAGTTWMYTFRQTYSQTTKIIVLGVKEMATKVSMYLGSDCSLTLSRVIVEMAGRYTCQQWSEDQQYGPDAHVYLHVVLMISDFVFCSLSVSQSSSDISPGLSLTLYCQLFSYFDFHCESLATCKDFRLSWLDQAGVILNTDSRFDVISYPEQCITRLSTTLVREDNNKQWRCGIYQRNELKTSDTFTVHYSAPDLTAKAEPTPQTEPAADTTKGGAVFISHH